MEIDDRAAFDAELESSKAMAEMLEEWYARVADQVIVYTDEVSQSR